MPGQRGGVMGQQNLILAEPQIRRRGWEGTPDLRGEGRAHPNRQPYTHPEWATSTRTR